LGECFTEPELWLTEVSHCGIWIFSLFCSCDLDLDSNVKAVESYLLTRQTDTTKIIYHAISRVVKHCAEKINYIFITMHAEI